MRLHKCHKVENYLIDGSLVDERRIWCYAQMNATLADQSVCGLVLVCVKKEILCIYGAEYNSTDLNLLYSCNIAEMWNVNYDKRLLAVRLSFSINEDSFRLDMDDWKRFSSVFERGE